MTEHLELWKSVEKTDPKHVKAITGKAYSGSSPRPQWLFMRATEVFGPCGIGWGFDILADRIVEDGADKLHVATVRLWYDYAGTRGTIVQIGGTPLAYTARNGRRVFDEDAPKKSVTDAVVKALSMLGFAADIFLGRWDDQKYVSDLREEFAQPLPSPFVSAKQVEELQALVDQLDEGSRGGFEAYIAKAYNAPMLSALPADRFDFIKTMLNRKLAA